ncbi:MAG TPA: metallophosphoesterase [Clostridia bacterium]
MKKRLKIIVLIAAAVFVTLIILLATFIDNKNIVYENYIINYDINDNSDVFDIKIIHLSDLHFPKIKVNISKMLEKLQQESPDIIAITGDLIDQSAKIDNCGAINFIKKLKSIAPIYYVNGNHEKGHKDADLLYKGLIENDVVILNNRSVNITIRNTRVTIMGIIDNMNFYSNLFSDNQELENNYRILLAHRPEKWPNYISDFNTIKPHLVLTGHAHGGQFRFFGKGFYAPNQGFFPKYDSGLYESIDVKMIVSRGIGNSVISFRFNNKPHIPIITIKCSN